MKNNKNTSYNFLKKNENKMEFEFNDLDPISDFPIETFPKPIASLINQLEKYSGFEPAIVSSAILFVVSTIIGNSRFIQVKSTWIDSPNLFIAIVGRRGSMKTPTVNYCLKPLMDDEKKFQIKYNEDLQDWLKIPKKNRNEENQPRRKQRFSNDLTVEGLVKTMNYNSNGLGIYKDELYGLFEEMNRYHSGGNIEFFLSAFSGGQFIKNRATSTTVTINEIFLSILGSIQPEKLKKLASTNTDNGMIDRWLFVESKNKAPRTTVEDMPSSLTSNYHSFINTISNNCQEYKLMQWDHGAHGSFIKKLNNIEDLMNSENCKPNLFTYLSKMKTYLARFVTIIATMEGTEVITIDNVNKAVQLGKYYIQSALRTFLSFENQNMIFEVLRRENAKSNKEKVKALLKYFPDMKNTDISTFLNITKRHVINLKK